MAFPGGAGQNPWQNPFQNLSPPSDASNREVGAMQAGPFEQHISNAAPAGQANLFGNPMMGTQQSMQHQQQQQQSEHELQFGGQDDMDTATGSSQSGNGQDDTDRNRMQVSDPSMWAITSDSDLVQRLEEQEELERLKFRKQEDLDDVSLALALQLQQEEEARATARQARKPLPPLFTGPESDNIDIFVCVDREVQPDLPKAPQQSLTSPSKGPPNSFFAAGAFPVAPPPSSSSSPPLPISVFPQPQFGSPNTASAGTASFTSSAGVLFGHDAAYFGNKGAAVGFSPDVNTPIDEDEAEEDEDDEFDAEDLRAVTVNRFATVAQVMQSIVKSDVFPIRKVSHIRHIAFRAIPVPPESMVPEGSSPMTSFQAPVFGTVFTTASNGAAASGDAETMNTGEMPQHQQRPDEFMILPPKMKISDLPITEDSVFKVVLRKRDRNRKRKRARGGRNGSSSHPANRDDLGDFNAADSDRPPSSSLEQVSEAEIWKQRFLEMQAKLNKVEERAATLEADLVMEKLPRLHLPENKRAKANEDPAAEQQMHTFNIPTLASLPSPPASAPKVIPRAFALPDSIALAAPPSLPLHNTPVDKPDVNKPHSNQQ